jgi:hypothetical protein
MIEYPVNVTSSPAATGRDVNVAKIMNVGQANGGIVAARLAKEPRDRPIARGRGDAHCDRDRAQEIDDIFNPPAHSQWFRDRERFNDGDVLVAR